MPNLPAIVRPMFPRLAHHLEFGKQNAQKRDQDSLLVPDRQALDVERIERGVDRSERQLYLEVGRLQGRYEALERARDRESAIYESVLLRKHELALAYMNRGNKVIKLRYKLKRAAIKYGCIALVAVVFAIWVDHKIFQADLAPSKPLPHYQNAVDR